MAGCRDFCASGAVGRHACTDQFPAILVRGERMTLILSLATPDFVVQVSDRKLTWPDGSLAEDHSNKSVLFKNTMAFSYTGPSRICGKPTDMWLSDVLCGCSPTQSLMDTWSQIKRQATADMARTPLSIEQKLTAFVGVGYAQQRRDDAALFPVICRISNFFGQYDKRLDVPATEFSIAFRFHAPGSIPWSWLETGFEMTEAEIRPLHRMMNRCSRKLVGPVPVVRLFTNAIREVAGRSSRVGKDVLTIIIPRTAAAHGAAVVSDLDAGGGMRAGPAIPDADGCEMYFEYIPEDANYGIHHGPILVWDGIAMSDFRSTFREH